MKGSAEHVLPIPFELETGRQYDLAELQDFWHSPDTILWFREHGYTYTPFVNDALRSLPPSGVLHEVDYPYAFYDSSGTMPLGALDISGKVLFSEDRYGRHVAIKLVRTNTDEYRVLNFLSQQSLVALKENCLIPVLDLLPNENFAFAVMPRWGTAIHLPWISKAREVLKIMHSMLKALAFLHEHNISHGDINQSNVLINHFSDSDILEKNWIRADLRSKGLLLYAVFDFDFSVMLRKEADRTRHRLPYQRSWGTFNYTMDTAQGEFDYNPFVLDVGILGVRFCSDYQHLTGEIPMLAPLLDKMTTRDLEHRFTASGALGFFEQMYSQLTEQELERYVQTRFREVHMNYDEYDRWKHVPPEFAKQWEAYREPPIPWITKVLRAICRRPWMCHIVPWSRWLFSRIRMAPCMFYTHFVGLGSTRCFI